MASEQPTKASLAASGLLILLRNLLLIASAVVSLAAIGWGAGKGAELVGMFPYRSASDSYFRYTDQDCIAYRQSEEQRFLRSQGRGGYSSSHGSEARIYFTNPCEIVVRGAPETLWQSLEFGAFVSAALVIAIALLVAFYEYLVGLGRRSHAKGESVQSDNGSDDE